jgi:hypothetical protein
MKTDTLFFEFGHLTAEILSKDLPKNLEFLVGSLPVFG